MRDPETARLLIEVRSAVVAARAGGVAVRACIFDATAAAVDGEVHGWPSADARKIAENACRAIEPPTAKAIPEPRRTVPLAARVLFRLANRIAERAQR